MKQFDPYSNAVTNKTGKLLTPNKDLVSVNGTKLSEINYEDSILKAKTQVDEIKEVNRKTIEEGVEGNKIQANYSLLSNSLVVKLFKHIPYNYKKEIYMYNPLVNQYQTEGGKVKTEESPLQYVRRGVVYSISDKTFTMEDFINESNEEYKSTCIAFMQEKHGEEYLVEFFRQNLTEVDTFVDKKDEEYLKGTTGGMNVGVYTLFKGEINNESIAYVRCYCPSTDRMFFLGVDEVHNTAKDAIASLYRIPSKLKTHIKSISRQGERFSTILTEKGKEVLKSMSEEEIAENSTLKGSEYFSLIKYEF